MNYNYISCIDSRRKPDIYIGGKINLPAKNYRFTEMKKPENPKKDQQEKMQIDDNENIETNKNTINDNNNNNKSANSSFKKSKNYLNDENQSNEKININVFETVAQGDKIKEGAKDTKTFDSDVDGNFIFTKVFLLFYKTK